MLLLPAPSRPAEAAPTSICTAAATRTPSCPRGPAQRGAPQRLQAKILRRLSWPHFERLRGAGGWAGEWGVWVWMCWSKGFMCVREMQDASRSCETG